MSFFFRSSSVSDGKMETAASHKVVTPEEAGKYCLITCILSHLHASELRHLLLMPLQKKTPPKISSAVGATASQDGHFASTASAGNPNCSATLACQNPINPFPV